MKVIGYTVTTLILTVLSALWSGYVLSCLWAWFVVKTFGLPQLSIPAAIGIALLVSYLAKGDSDTETKGKEFWEVLIEGTVKGILKPLFALIIGAIVALWL